MDKTTLKRIALDHPLLLKVYRSTFGKLKTGLYFGLQRKALQKKGPQTINTIAKKLDSEGAVYFAAFGTLLGMIRDNKLIPYDRDIDFAVHFDNDFTPKKLDRLLRSIGLKRIKAFYYKGKPVELTYTNGITHIDFFRLFDKGDHSLVHVFYKDVDRKYPSKNHYTVLELALAHIDGVKKTTINGITVNIPTNYEDFLASAYTENWRIPDPNWSYLNSPGKRIIEDDFGLLK